MSKNHDELLGHAEDNDGIEEYDNPLPDWWVGMFVFTVIFAVGYTAEYHFLSDRSQVARYEAEMLAAAEKWPQSEAPKTLAFDAATIDAGREIFTTTCASCHGAELQGGIGPNLVDAEWIHGGAPEQVVTTITEGVAAKGMPAWGSILGPDKVSKVAAFVISQGQGEAAGGGVVPASTAEGAASAPEPAPEVEPGAQAPELAVAEAAEEPAAADAADPVVAGAQVFAQNCATCHGADMTGLVGPNLVDGEWIHGGELDQIIATIRDGVPEKGMLSWGPILGDEKIEQVARYVHEKANGG